MDARSKFDVMVNDVLVDVNALVKEIDSIKREIPASINQSVEEAIEKSNANFSNFAAVLQEIKPSIHKAIAAETERAEIQVGILADAAERLNAAALELGQKRLASVSDSIDTAVRTAVKAAIDNSLSGAVNSNISEVKVELGKLFNSVNVDVINLKKELDSIERKAKKIAEEAEKAAQGSTYTRLGTMFASGLVSAICAVSLLVIGIDQGLIKVNPSWDTDAVKEVASQLYYWLTPKK